MAHRFEIHKDESDQFRLGFKYSGKVIFGAETSTRKASVQKAIRSIKASGPAVHVDDLPLVQKAPSGASATSETRISKPAASAAAKPVAAAKAAAKAVGAAVKSAVKTSSRK